MGQILCEVFWRQGSRHTEKAWKSNELGQRVPGCRACKYGKGQHLLECPGKEEEKVKKGPEGREPRFWSSEKGPRSSATSKQINNYLVKRFPPKNV